MLPFLFNAIRRLAQALGLFSSPLLKENEVELSLLPVSPTEAQFHFWEQLFQATADSDGEPQVVYPLLDNQIHLLDDNFAILLGNWATIIFREVESNQDQSYDFADTIVIFSELIREFPRGRRDINLEIAIVGNRVATIVFTRQAFPTDWADTQNNLGIAYCQRIRGDRADNLELAIQYYLAALEVRTRQAFPYDWAVTQNNLGNAYRNRIQGERAENLEAAIYCFKNTLEVFTHETYPEEWAQTQYNLGNAYFERIRGERAENLEEVIRCCKAALEVCTRHALPEKLAITKNNLGEAYRNRINGTKTENLDTAIQCFNEVLEVRTRQAFPEKWAITQHNLAGAYFERERLKGTTGNFEAAIRCLKAALEIRTPEAFPIDCVNTMGKLGFVYQSAQQFNHAYDSFAHAVDMVESLRSEIVYGSGIAEDKQKLAAEWNKLYQGMVEVCLVLNNPAKALEYVERSKTRHLAELIASRDLYPTGTKPDNERNELQQLQQDIDVEKRRLATDAKPNYAHLNQLRQQYNELNPLPHISFEQIQALTDENTVILEWHIAHDTFQTFIITCHSITFWQSSANNLKDLRKRVTAYMLLYHRKGQQNWWHTQLEARLQNIAEILHLDEILAKIPKECSQLILIPHRFLHFLPLHALPLADGKCLLDKFDSVRIAPSCQLLQQIQQQQRSDFSNFFAIQNPEDNLSYADLEVEIIRSFFFTAQVLEKQAATKVALTDNQNLSWVHCSHFSCHGTFTFNLESPLESALLLANEERFTLADIFGLSLNQCRLVTLSACEMGLTDPTSISDEYIGLPSGFLYAGCANVVSSLWTVNQVSTAFLMIKFYQNLKENQSSVAKALNDAQRWLRDATQQQLLDWANQLNLDDDKMTQIEEQLDWYDSDDTPYNEPYHWAAFCAIGQ
jgi:CHAT domain-containing protein